MGKSFFIAALLTSAVRVSGVRIDETSDSSTISYYVSTTGSDTESGSLEAPFATLQHCVDVAGDNAACYLRGGDYHEEVVINGKQSLLISNYNDEVVTFDGTIPISDWSVVDESKQLYEAKGQTTWQLFKDGKSLTLARYPNAASWSAAAWEHDGVGSSLVDSGWLVQSTSSTPNHMVDANGEIEENVHEYSLLEKSETSDSKLETSGNSLSAAGVSFNGCPVVLNTGHWSTVVSTVRDHTAGGSTFEYDDETPFTSVCCDGDGRYFIEGCEAALDAAGEWTYNAAGELLLLSPDSLPPSNVRGKVQTYALSFYDSDHIQLHGINFFATSIIMFETYNSEVADCKFEYASYSRRALGEVHAGPLNDEKISPKMMSAAKNFQGSGVELKAGTAAPVYFGSKWKYNCNITLARNEFSYTDGVAVYFRACGHDTIEDNYFHNIGYSAAGEYGAINFMSTHNEHISRNSFDTTGGSESVLLNGEGSLVEYNFFTNTGRVQSDGAAIHAYKTAQNGLTYRYNWAMNSPRGGFRFDAAEDGNFGSNGTMHHNVAFNNDYYGYQIKGFEHKVYHNTGLDQGYMDICLSRCYPSTCAESIYYNNNDSIAELNVGKLSAYTARWEAIDSFESDVYKPTLNGNVDLGKETAISDHDLYMGPLYGDWRPREGSVLVDTGFTIAGINDLAGYTVGSQPDIGAYEFGASTYWIPGRVTDAPSMPVPFDGSAEVGLDASLMFLGGRDAVSHNVFMAKKGEPLVSAANLSVPDNILTSPALEPGEAYDWQVVSTTSAGTMHEGPVWSFTVIKSSSASYSSTGDAYVYRWSGNDNYGDEKKLIVFKVVNDKPIRMSFLKFEIKDDLRIAAFKKRGYSVTYTSATLYLYVGGLDITQATLWSIDSTSWSETEITYNTMPTVTAEVATITNAASGSWVAVSIPTSVLGEGEIGFGLTTSMTSSSAGIYFSSKEGSYPPELKVEFELTAE
jgi:hypothetical protein